MPARLVALIALALGVVAAIAIARWQGQRTVQHARSVLAHGDGLREGARVAYRRIDVGTVTRLAFEEHGIAVDLSFHRAVPLRTSDTVTLRTMGLLGDRVLDIVPGPPSAPLLADGGLLAARPARPDLSPEELLKRFQPSPETVYRDTTLQSSSP